MEPVILDSTNEQSPPVGLREALLRGQAPDRGLYWPRRFPPLSPEEIAAFAGLPYWRIAWEVLRRYMGGVLDAEALETVCREAYDFDVPLEPVCNRIYVMRLDRGPSASFKDFAARWMARVIGRFVREEGGELTILTATSGDTGSAVASAFHDVPGIRVIVLFPVGEVSERQRRQMTTLRGNIRTLAVGGKFDDCQAMVKRAFSDSALEAIPLTSANSINIGRLLPQSVYYFYAASRVAACGEPVVFGEVDVEWGDAGGWAVSLPGARRRPHARVSPSGSRVWFTPEVFAVVGNRWSLAVVIGALWGMRRFRDFHIGLAIPPAVLTDRLHLLTEAGILATTPSSARADWWDYRPTPRAQELALFFLLALGWAARWWPHTREVLTVTHRRCAAPLRLVLTCAACGAAVTGASVRVDSTIIPLPHHSAAASASPTPGES